MKQKQSKPAAYFDKPAMNVTAITSKLRTVCKEVEEAIQEKEGSTESIPTNEFAQRIKNLSGNTIPQCIGILIFQDGLGDGDTWPVVFDNYQSEPNPTFKDFTHGSYIHQGSITREGDYMYYDGNQLWHDVESSWGGASTGITPVLSSDPIISKTYYLESHPGIA